MTMSTDSTSATEPSLSAVSFSSYAESFSSATSHSHRSSMDFPFLVLYSVFRGSSNAFWHPPMLPTDRAPPVPTNWHQGPFGKDCVGFIITHPPARNYCCLRLAQRHFHVFSHIPPTASNQYKLHLCHLWHSFSFNH